MNSTALAASWVRSWSIAVPLLVTTTDSSMTSLPWVTVTPSQVAGPLRTASTARAAVCGSTPRVCTATLAGLRSRRMPGCSAAISRSASRSRCRTAISSGVRRSTKPMSNSEPWLPTRCTSLGSRESVARSRSARPETTATLVCGSEARARTAATDSGSGTALLGSSTIGASVPS